MPVLPTRAALTQLGACEPVSGDCMAATPWSQRHQPGVRLGGRGRRECELGTIWPTTPSRTHRHAPLRHTCLLAVPTALTPGPLHRLVVPNLEHAAPQYLRGSPLTAFMSYSKGPLPGPFLTPLLEPLRTPPPLLGLRFSHSPDSLAGAHSVLYLVHSLPPPPACSHPGGMIVPCFVHCHVPGPRMAPCTQSMLRNNNFTGPALAPGIQCEAD